MCTFKHSKFFTGDKRKKKQEENIEDENEMAPPSKKSKKSTSINLLSINFWVSKGVGEILPSPVSMEI